MSSEIPKKDFFFLRHGESVGNVQEICQGQSMDYPLTDNGRNQAMRARELLSGLQISTVCHSPQSRAAETAQIVAGDLPLVSSDLLKERGFGPLEGGGKSELYRLGARERDGEKIDLGGNFETVDQLNARAFTALVECLSHPDHVLLVSHGRFFNSICAVLSLPPILQLGNCIPIQFRYIEGRWSTNVIG